MTTNETSRIVRWLVIIVLGAATAGMAAVSLRANYLFGYGFGQTPERAQVFGWANVAADLWKVGGLIVITSLWRAQQKRSALSLMPIWVLCVLWGLPAQSASMRKIAPHSSAGAKRLPPPIRMPSASSAEIDDKLRTVKTERSVTQVDAAIAAVLARPIMSGERMRGTVGKLSANCTKDERVNRGGLSGSCFPAGRARCG